MEQNTIPPLPPLVQALPDLDAKIYSAVKSSLYHDNDLPLWRYESLVGKFGFEHTIDIYATGPALDKLNRVLRFAQDMRRAWTHEATLSALCARLTDPEYSGTSNRNAEHQNALIRIKRNYLTLEQLYSKYLPMVQEQERAEVAAKAQKRSEAAKKAAQTRKDNADLKAWRKDYAAAVTNKE